MEFNSSLLGKRDSDKNINNSTETFAIRFILIGIIISCYIYFEYMIKSAIGFIHYKNLNFLFPLIAATFAFANNANDIVHFLYHPEDCYTFYILFKVTATLNWAPISWLQTFRLSLISRIYLSKRKFLVITILSVTFSLLYCLCYFLNLSEFDYTTSDFMGCGVTNDSKYIYMVMAFDIIDSLFSLGSISIIIYNAIKNLRELNTKNEKLNNLVSEGILELIIITISKIVIYPLISITSYQPSFDIFWDVLSVIVIYSSYRMVNFPYKSNPKEKNIGRKIFNFIGSVLKFIKFTFVSNKDDYDNSTAYDYSNSNNTFNSKTIVIIDDKNENPDLKGINI